MKRLILHAGTAKTGTTAIQSTLFNWREKLRQRGIFYPDPSYLGSGQHAHHNLAHAYGNRPNYRRRAETFLAKVRKEANEHETVMLSSEAVYRQLSNKNGGYWNRRTDYLKSLAAALSGFEVEVLLFFRRRDYFVESLYHEHVLAGLPTGPFNTFVETHLNLLDYDRQVQAFKAEFQRVQIQSYEAANGNVVQTFFRLHGIDISAVAEPRERLSVDGRVTMWIAQEAKRSEYMDDVLLSLKGFAKSGVASGLFTDERKVTLWQSMEKRCELLARFNDYGAITDDRSPAMLTADVREIIGDAYERWKAKQDS
jgi:hypothetical protein